MLTRQMIWETQEKILISIGCKNRIERNEKDFQTTDDESTNLRNEDARRSKDFDLILWSPLFGVQCP